MAFVGGRLQLPERVGRWEVVGSRVKESTEEQKWYLWGG